MRWFGAKDRFGVRYRGRHAVRARGRSCEVVDAIAREHRDEIDRKIADLQALRRKLGSMIDQCRHGTVADCRIIEALSPAADPGGQNLT